MYYFLPKSNGRVDALLSPKDGKPIDGFLSTETIPSAPDFGEGNAAHLYYLDGELTWKPVPIACEENGIVIDWGAGKEEVSAQISAARAAEYVKRVDPITSEIERLKEMDGTPEEIDAARNRRAEEVAAIKAEYPYPET